MLHYTGMTTGEAALARLLDPAAEVSSHYLVWEDGRIDQLVAEADRAWHAGRSWWGGDTDLNSVSVGIEMVNAGHDGGLPPYPAAQVAAVARLAPDICRRRAIAPARVLGHSDIAPERKLDPGEHFPWHQLAEAGVGLWPRAPVPTWPAPPAHDPAEVARLHARLAAIGYADLAGAGSAAVVVRAFQRHWRPDRVDGCIDASTAGLIDAVAAAAG